MFLDLHAAAEKIYEFFSERERKSDFISTVSHQSHHHAMCFAFVFVVVFLSHFNEMSRVENVKQLTMRQQWMMIFIYFFILNNCKSSIKFQI